MAKVRKVIIREANTDFIGTLCEIALNVLKGNIPLSAQQYKMLQKKKTFIRLAADKKVGHLKKKKHHQSVRRLPAPFTKNRYPLYHQSYSMFLTWSTLKKMFLVPQHQLQALKQITGSIRQVAQNELDKALLDVLEQSESNIY